MKARALTVAVAAALIASLAACSQGADDSATSGSSGAEGGGETSFVFAEATAPDTLDTMATPITRSRYAWVLAYECLLKQSPDGQINPNLAESYEESEDGLTVTYKLRDGVKFHNGEALTSADVKYTYERQNTVGVPYVKERIATLESVETPDDKTVVFKLKALDPGFVLNTADPTVAGCAIYSSKANEDELGTKMVGTGPFRQTAYDPNTKLEMERFEDYWGDKTKVDNLTVLYMPSDSARRTALQSGQVDATFVDTAGAEAMKNDEGVKVVEIQTPEASHLQINNTMEPFSDVRVRRAISLAIDREEISRVAYQNGAVPSLGIPSILTWAPKADEFQFVGPDIEKAKALLAEAGYPDGFETTYVYIAQYSPGTEALGQVLQAQLAKVGIKMNLEPLEQTAWLERSGGTKHDYELSWNQYGFFADPYQYVRAREGRQGPPPAEMAASIAAISEAKSTDEYLQRITEYQKLANEYVWPTIPIASLKAYLIHRNEVGNIEVDASQSRSFLAKVTKGN